ncbi:hypothetical protein CYMTET_11653 [Cymbomonas tetramitiformis]|uniref:PPPDE domain-containing protein n=1 Tax=Cymbomonas tetramitiformis TaxID=36881 RepID=A0AAE0GLX4_9CHLO|nr:hypothetical protein CYMTET_11653 [Cymbomonas tetramitiformis]|eukprot:gene11141-13163_t
MGEPIIMQVYDLSQNSAIAQLNKVTYELTGAGGLFHTAIEIYGMEYSFGYTENGTGVFGNLPTKCTMHTYKSAVTLGETKLSKLQVKEILQQLMVEYPGTSYDLLNRNCCSFCDDFSRRLGLEEGIPKWVHRFANIGASTVCAVETAVAKAKSFDEHHSISLRAKKSWSGVASAASAAVEKTKKFDSKHNISSTAAEQARKGYASLASGWKVFKQQVIEPLGPIINIDEDEDSDRPLPVPPPVSQPPPNPGPAVPEPTVNPTN